MRTLHTILLMISFRLLVLAQTGIVLDYPNGGETLPSGIADTIRWTDFPSQANTTVNLFYSTNGGSTWATIKNKVPNTGMYAWAIPNTASAQCRVKVTTNYGAFATDMSDNDFTITGGATSIVPPDINGNFHVHFNANSKEIIIKSLSIQESPYTLYLYNLLGDFIFSVENQGNSSFYIPDITYGIYIIKIDQTRSFPYIQKIQLTDK